MRENNQLKEKTTQYPIRILQVVTHMNRGGLENMIMNYYRKMNREKIQFDFLTHRPENEKKDFDDEIRSLGGRIYHLPKLNPFSCTYKKELNQFFRQHPEYKIIHVHQDCMSSVILKAARKNGIKVRIAHCHSSSQDKNPKYLIKLIYRHSIKKEATQLFACGQIAGKWMFCTDDFEVLPNAIDARKYRYDPIKRREMRAAFGIDDDTFVLGNVARFSTVKNQTFLVDVFEKLLGKREDSRLVLVGDGELFEEIKSKIIRLGIEDKVLLLGLRSDVADVMQALDVFCLPSLYEGLPVTMIEAQAEGLSCVISDGVPKDCMITDAVQRISLQESADRWAEKIMKMDTARKDNYQLIVGKHFDVTENAVMLQNKYLELFSAAAGD